MSFRGRRAYPRHSASASTLFFNGALRLHAAQRAHVANVHETVCDRSAFFWFHRLITTGTSNDGRFVH